MASAGAFDPGRTDRRLLSPYGLWTVLMARTLPFRVADVWTALTDPHRLPMWLGAPQGVLEYGHMFTLYGATCQVVACQPPNRLDLSWSRAGETNALRLSVLDRPDGTEVVVEHSGIRDPARLSYGPAWEERLTHLEEHLSGQQVPQHDCGQLELALRPLWWTLLPEHERPAV